MKNTGQKLILISFALALIAAVAIFIYLQSLKSEKEVSKKTTIIVAVEAIPARTLIDKKMVKEIQVDDNPIFADYLKDSSKIIGKYTKESFGKNEGFLTSKLVDKGEEELSLNIDKNHRAISISTTGASGVSKLLKPGDYVDIIAFVGEKKEGSKVIRPDKAKIILQNIKILAVDQQLSREAKVNTNAKSEDKEKTQTNFLITLSVEAADTEKLVFAENIGNIKLALRPLKEDTIIETNGVTYEELFANSSKESEVKSDEKYTSYTVKKGDTLKSISKRFYGIESKYKIIRDANNISDENLILTGEIIKIPTLQK
ncbi:LysM domain/BON superfamily protein [Clostridium homopropionicum DSM 5847]|uniref:LysM domain/BON superfamily protein n=1 Tax=Clostridium homopropionicum DSM 5847 TaxID=1121318 RepID=A0A0L6Z8Y2_9CLOT|nr:Flp pilus assembly protein CpaB [Clostridium homopropionicum]KOA19233.1 LysM domain/BON superfamily protein [Clostridium homopropionicum DSM 5847]SFG18254.1 pilus assembly protein CpaB [Clostridium homopropionicum]